ncbi:hypothetical protein niasHT_037994 [Heterodera trifolii]|uniref:Transmembrane protein n=1 Tax=Heterodera trifolii TaxID=157864 RepID=A0ABD2HNG8_9BILA
MYFWAEKYFSGSSLDQQANSAGGGAADKRRGSRSGSGGIERKGSFRVDHHQQRQQTAAAGEHRKSLSQLADEIAPRRESRTGGGGVPPTTERAAPSKGSGGTHRKSLSAAPLGVPFVASPGGDRLQHRTSTLGEMAAAAAVGNASASAILMNIARALIVRGLLMAHSLLCIWAAAETQGDNSVWAFALLAVCLVGEGFYAVVVRAGDDPKWFSPAVLLYLFATVPPLWLVHASMCPTAAFSHLPPPPSSVNLSALCATAPAAPSFGLQPNPREDTVGKQFLGHSLFLALLLTRWLLPRAELSREELTQILLAYAAVVTDILEFVGLLNACAVCADPTLQTAVLGAWTLSLAQFALVLTASRARKMRIALATKIIVTTNCRADFRQAFYDMDIWAVLISLALQDIPFLVVRLSVFCWLWTTDFGMLLFAAKNLLIIILQCYRVSVLLNDRYLNPPLDARARSLIEERRQSMAPHAKFGKMSMIEIGGSGGMLNMNSEGGTTMEKSGTMRQKQQR